MREMTRSELIILVVERLSYLTQKDAEIIVDTIFDSMIESLAQGDRIEIRGFGSFAVKHRDPREGRNPKTGETVYIPAKRIPHFKLGKRLYDRINPAVTEQEI